MLLENGHPRPTEWPAGPLIHLKSRPGDHLHTSQLPHISLSRPKDCACIPVSPHTLLLPSDRKISRCALVYTRIDTATVTICTALLPSHFVTPTVVLSHLAVHWCPLLSHILPRSDYLQRVPDVRHLHAFHITNKQPSACTPHPIHDHRYPHSSQIAFW